MITGRLRVKKDKTRQKEAEYAVKAQGGVNDLAAAIVADIKASWSPSSPSDRGKPPAKVTGNLDANTQVRGDSEGAFNVAPDSFVAFILIDTDYASILEGRAQLNRPYLEPAMKRAKKTGSFIFKKRFRR